MSSDAIADASQILSPVSSLVEECADARGALLQPWRLGREQIFRHAPTRWSDNAVAHEARQSTVIIGTER